MISRVRLYADTGRAVIITIERVRVKMTIQQVENKRLMIFWHAELVGWIVCWKQGIEKTMEIASTDEADIANLHGPIRVPWTWPP